MLKGKSFWAILVVLTLPYVLGSWHQIQEIDSIQYAEIAREMVESGKVLPLRDDYQPYLDKPPMTFWMVALSYRLFGVNNVSYRIPAIIMALLSLVATYRIGTLVYGRGTARLGTVLLASCIAYTAMLSSPKVDMILIGFLTLAFWAYYERERRPWTVHLFYLFAGFGMLTKGPIALVVPLLSVGTEVVFRRNREALRSMRPLTGLAIIVAVTAPWYIALYREFGFRGPYFALFEQSFGRIFVRTYRNRTDPFFFLHTLLWSFQPWAFPFLLGLIIGVLRAVKFKVLLWKEVPLYGWFIWTFLGISLSSYKLPHYLFWTAPAAALIAGRFLMELSERPSSASGRTLDFLQVSASGLVLSATGVLLLLAFPPRSQLVPALYLALCAAFGAAFLRSLGAPLGRWVALPMLACWGFSLFFGLYFYPQLLSYQPGEELGKLVKSLEPEGHLLPAFRAYCVRSVAFYSGREVRRMDLGELRKLVKTEGGRLLLTTPESFALLREHFEVVPVKVLPRFRTSKPTLKFLYHGTRPRTLKYAALVRVSPRAPSACP